MLLADTLNLAYLPECVLPYYDVRGKATVKGELIFKCQPTVPKVMRKELLQKTHTTHTGRVGCIRRARETFFWPRMTTELKEKRVWRLPS